MGKKNPPSNDQKANAKNPQHIDFKRNQDNRANQKNPNNPAYNKSCGDNTTKK